MNDNLDFLSITHIRPFMWDGIEYTNVLAAYQSSKLESLDDREVFSNLNPKDAIIKGKSITPYFGWEYKKVNILQDIIINKLYQNQDLLEKIYDTPDNLLKSIDYIGGALLNLKKSNDTSWLDTNAKLDKSALERITGIKRI